MPGDYTRFRFSALERRLRHPAAAGPGHARPGLERARRDHRPALARRDRGHHRRTGVVPRETPHGFEIQVIGGNDLTIGPGRIYVDGLLAENHGSAPQFDTVLEETPGTQPIAFARATLHCQPVAVRRTNPFAVPTGAGPHLVYLDVWKREVTVSRGARPGGQGGGRGHHDAAADRLAGQGIAQHSGRLDLRQPIERLGGDHRALGRAAHHRGGRRAAEHRPLHHPAQRRLPRHREPHLPRRGPHAGRLRHRAVQMVAQRGVARHAGDRHQCHRQRAHGGAHQARIRCCASRPARGWR